LRVAGRAEVALCVGLHAMLTQEVPIVHYVALGRRHLSGQIHMAAAAVAGVPLALVRVATETSRMLDSNVVRAGRDVHVTSHAVTCTRFLVDRMRETQMLARHLGGLTISGAPVAVRASIGIVRFLVASHAVCSRRKMERTGLTGFWDSGVAPEAVDALDEVSTVFERVVFILLLETEHFGAAHRRAQEHAEYHDGRRVPHCFPCHLC